MYDVISSINSPLQIGFSQPALITTIIPCVLITLTALYAFTEFRGLAQKKRLPLVIGIGLAIVGVIGGIALMMYLNYNAVGSKELGGFQGRYLLPLFAPLALLIGMTVRVSIARVKALEKYSLIGIVIVFALSAPAWILNIVY